MRKVTIEIAGLGNATARVKEAWATRKEQGEFISFESVPLMLRELTGKRWEIVHFLQNEGTMSIREVARQLGRDVKNVHTDIQALIRIGLVEQAKTGVSVPYDEIHANFTLKKHAA